MKKLLYGLGIAAACLLTACNQKEVDARLDSLESRVAKLEEQVKGLNSQVDLINQLLTNKLFVVSATELEDGSGYRLVLQDKNGNMVEKIVYNGKKGNDGHDGLDGKDGSTPVVSVKLDTDGLYYWTINGEWLLVDGKKVRASGVDGKDGEDGQDGNDGLTPEFKVGEDGYWYVRVGEGEWEQAGPSYTEITGPIASIDATREDVVVITLADGSAITVPKAAAAVKLQLVFDENAFTKMKAGATASTSYSVVAPAGITYSLDSYEAPGWVVTISSPKDNKGTITITLPEDATTGKILFVANGSDGSCFVKVIHVGVSGNTVYNTDSSSGSLDLPAGATDVQVSEDWVTVSGNKLILSENTTYDARTATVTYTDADGNTQTITIVQAQKDAIVLTQAQVTADPKGETIPYYVKANVTVTAKSNVDWIKVSEATKGLEELPFEFAVSANETGTARNGEVTFSNGEISQTVKVSQAAAGEEPGPGPGPDPSSSDFVLVTSASDLTAGDELLIVNLEGPDYYTLGAQANNNRRATAVTVSAQSIAYSDLPADATIVVLSGSAGAWNFEVDGGYLANSSSNSNRLLTSETITENATWTISIASSGDATIQALGGSRNLLRFNSNNGSPLFSCYSSGQDPVAIYRKPGGPVTPVTEYSTIGCYLGSTQYLYRSGTDQYLRAYSDNDLTFALMNPSENEQAVLTGYSTSMKVNDEVDVALAWRKGTSTVLSKTYSMSVLKEENGKVWIGDSRGNGFIIKK